MDEDEQWILGIDEAGRGPVLGPMVYGCCLCRESDKEKVSKMGFADSKQLKIAVRDKLLEDIKSSPILRWSIHVISPETLSEQMMGSSRVSLNEISHNSAIMLIKQILESGISLSTCYLDTVGPPDSYVRKLNGVFTGLGIKFVVESKADDTYPIVSAASICAKCSRDEILEDWKFREGVKFSKEIGCGYPSDEVTQNWLKNNCDLLFGFPTITRFCWQTTRDVLNDKNATEIKWGDEVAENSLTKFFGSKKGGDSKCPILKNNYMKSAATVFG